MAKAKKIELENVKTVGAKPAVIVGIAPEQVDVVIELKEDEPRIYHKIEGKSLSNLFAAVLNPDTYVVLLEDNTDVVVSKKVFDIFAKILPK